MNFDEYQELARETDLDNHINYYYLGLCEEAGEVAGTRKRFLRNEGETDRDDLTKELGDVLWYLSMIAHRYNISLNDIAATNITKLNDRFKRGVIQGKGDRR